MIENYVAVWVVVPPVLVATGCKVKNSLFKSGIDFHQSRFSTKRLWKNYSLHKLNTVVISS
jgi:hypothetical protein